MMDVIVSAAGNSRRFGKNKLLYPFRGKPLIFWTLEVLRQCKEQGLFRNIYVVSQYEEMMQMISRVYPEFLSVWNTHPERGISESVKRGLKQLLMDAPDSEGCLFAVADQPFLTVESFQKIIRLWQQDPQGIIVAKSQQRYGNPVIFSREFYPDLQLLTGDIGGKAVWKRHPDRVQYCTFSEKELLDLDTEILATLYNLPFFDDQKHVISIVGGGGKTSLMYALAHCYSSFGKTVIVTTATHIARPEDGTYAYNRKELLHLLKERSFAVIGDMTSEGKLRSPAWITMEECARLADIVLIEADGAKHMPCKVPIEKEPVIVPNCDIVLAVAGMDAVHRPLKEVCFRETRALQVLGKTDVDQLITTADMAYILSSEDGAKKSVANREYHVFLNKCDNDLRIRQAQEIRQLLMKHHVSNVHLISLKNDK